MKEFLFGSWYICWGTKPAAAPLGELPCAAERLIAAE
jgi:hypothetical protein